MSQPALVDSLDRPELFCEWIGEVAGTEVSPEDPWWTVAERAVGCCLAIAFIEDHVGDVFPVDLVESLVTVRDLYEWTLVRSGQLDAERGP